MFDIVQRSYYTKDETTKILNRVNTLTGIDPKLTFNVISVANTEDKILHKNADVLIVGIGDNYNISPQLDDVLSFLKAGKAVIITHGLLYPDDVGPDKCKVCSYCTLDQDSCTNFKTYTLTDKLAKIAELSVASEPGEYNYYHSVNVITDHEVLHTPYDVSAISEIQRTHTFGVTYDNKLNVILGKTAQKIVHLGINGKLAIYNIGHINNNEKEEFKVPSDNECKLFVNLLTFLTK